MENVAASKMSLHAVVKTHDGTRQKPCFRSLGFPSSRREAMVGGVLARASAFRVGLGVSGATIVSGSYT